MATRATVQIIGVTFAKVYIHWDGYPDHMMPWLEAFTKDFSKNRGNDGQYALAQLLRFSERHKRKFNLDKSTHTGYGLVPFDSDCGQAYSYVIDLGRNNQVTWSERK